MSDNETRIDGRGLSREAFYEQYADRPRVITHLADDWPASSEWSREKLCERCGEGQWRVGCNDGKAVTLSLPDFFHYCDSGFDMLT